MNEEDTVDKQDTLVMVEEQPFYKQNDEVSLMIWPVWFSHYDFTSNRFVFGAEARFFIPEKIGVGENMRLYKGGRFFGTRFLTWNETLAYFRDKCIYSH